MSELKKIKDEFINKLRGKLNLSEITEIKSNLFGKNGLISSQFKNIGTIAENGGHLDTNAILDLVS